MNKEKQAYVYAAFVIAAWATVASAFKLTLGYIDPLQLVLYSTLTSALVIFLILAAQGKLGLLRKMTGKDWLASLALGIINPFLYYAILFAAYDVLPAQEAQPLNQTWIILLPLLSIIILRQKIGVWSVAGLFVGFAGAFVISTHGDLLAMHFTNVAGVMLALGSAVLWSFFWIFNVRDRRDATLKLFLNFALSLPFIAAATMIFSSPFPPDNRGLLGAAYIGVFEMGLTFVLWLYALKYAKTTAHVSVLVYIVPFLSLIVIHFVLREEILFSTVAGLLLIVAGILIQQAGSLRGKNAKNADAAKRTKRAEKPKRPTS